MKKTIAWLLALVLVLCSMSCQVLANGQTESATDLSPAPLRLSFCDTPLGWVNGAHPTMSIVADGNNYTEAPASLKISGTGASMVIYTTFAPLDISPYTYLEFDFYTTDLDPLRQSAGQIELSSSGRCDVAEAASGPGHIFNQVTKEGWNHIVLPLNTFGYNSRDPEQVFNPKTVNYFRFYLVQISAAFSFQIDNMYFSNGEGSLQDSPAASEFSTAAPLKNNGYLYGDIGIDGTVNSTDALLALQYTVNKTALQNKQLAMGDVNDDASVDAGDALQILRRIVGKQDVFPVEQKETLPEQVEVGINQSHLVHTQYPTQTRVVAETDVIYWGAKGDGVTDDTVAFQKALAYAGAKEGGTVFVPAGKFAIRGNLTIPNGVTLQGDAPTVSADKAVEGTLLLAYAGRGDANGKPFITMDSASALANCSIYYPEQTMGDITPYPWTIRQGGHYGIAVTNVRLVNSYQGIGMFYTNSLQNIRGVVGTALKTGLILDGNVDICRVENVNFTPDSWLNSGLCDTADAQNLHTYLYENATAFKFEHVDWTYVTDIAAKGYHVALGNSKPTTREADNSPNGHVYNVNFEDCFIGYHAQYVNPIGMMITKGTIEATIPVWATEGFVTSFSLNGLHLIANGGACVYNQGTGVITVEDCRLTGSGSAPGIAMKNGTISATNVAFEQCSPHIQAADGVTATATNCMTEKTLTCDGTVKAVWDDSLVVADTSLVSTYDYNQEAVTFTAGDAFVDLTREPYCADTTNTWDIGALLQVALNDVAKAGGGVVYLPSGRYRLDTNVTVPAGVELKGSCTFPQHSHAYSTTFYTTHGLGGDADTAALITLEPTAGINGFKVYYDQQPGGEYDCEAYAFTARGTGINNYILNVNFINSFYQTDFASHRCDGHYINGATGYPLEQGIVVGGGSKHGIVRDCQFNVHYFSDNPYYKTLPIDGDSFHKYGTDHSEAYVVKDTTHQIMYHNFVLGVHSGIAIDEGADVFVLAHGTDGGDRAMTVRGTPSGHITMVNTQLVVIGPGTTKAYINMEESFTGTVNMTQTNMWGQPTDYSVLVGGGRLNLSQGTNVRSGNVGVKVWNDASLVMNNINHLRNDLLYDLHLDSANEAVTFGNIYGSGGRLLDADNRYKGNEFSK